MFTQGGDWYALDVVGFRAEMNVPTAIVVDPAGMLGYVEKMDGVQYRSLDDAIDKAKSAALYKRSTTVFLPF